MPYLCSQNKIKEQRLWHIITIIMNVAPVSIIITNTITNIIIITTTACRDS
ncbi:MAG: hypothetical protein J6O23_10325 [Prevotella sp.]|nr:hypothetical protein [Prevotella sp.]